MSTAATGFSGESRGQVILPEGSDGVVDVPSQRGGMGTRYTIMPSSINIAHADLGLLFGVAAGESQTTDPRVADRVMQLLNGPANGFGAFQLPTLLSAADEQRYANTLVLGVWVRDTIHLITSLKSAKSARSAT